MSRKRRNKQQPSKQPKQAVPDEILAEGSGPHDDAVEAVEAAAPELPAMDEAGTLAVAAVQPADGELIEALGDEAEIVPIESARAEADGEPVLEAAAAEGEGEVDGELIEVEGEVGATLPTSAATMDGKQLKHLVEALVFASDKPVTLLRLRQLTRVADVTRLEAALAELATDFADRGLILQQVSGGYQFRTQTRYSAWVQQLIAGRPVRLSRAQLETLAIIAYRQPITRPEIDDIRGVDSSGTLKVLLDRALVRILGKREEVGRPMLYGTTKEFLDFFSLGDLRELPTLREYSELTPESKRVMTNKLGADPADAPAAPMEADAAVEPQPEPDAAIEIEVAADEIEAAPAEVEGEPAVELEAAPTIRVINDDVIVSDDDELADPAVLAEAAAVARALASDHEDVDTMLASELADEALDEAPPLDPADDQLAEPDPGDEMVD